MGLVFGLISVIAGVWVYLATGSTYWGFATGMALTALGIPLLNIADALNRIADKMK
jgi:hypothetical protein